ncbi:MAG: hypothetical protein QOF51_1527 [Chloroflexota bacterium]|nr:hypothetical protein [Chloroflexota bacterium]
MADPDVVIVGAGSNGLTAAALPAGAGLLVTILDAEDYLGAAVRSGPLTVPECIDDRCSASLAAPTRRLTASASLTGSMP